MKSLYLFTSSNIRLSKSSAVKLKRFNASRRTKSRISDTSLSGNVIGLCCASNCLARSSAALRLARSCASAAFRLLSFVWFSSCSGSSLVFGAAASTSASFASLSAASSVEGSSVAVSGVSVSSVCSSTFTPAFSKSSGVKPASSILTKSFSISNTP